MNQKKILLSLMPFWSPLNPPLGISVLKAFLKSNGFNVHVYDFNTIDELWTIQSRFFNLITQIIPVNKRNNFYMVGIDIFNLLLMTYLNQLKGKKKLAAQDYLLCHEIVIMLLEKNYHLDSSLMVNDSLLTEIDQMMEEFYINLEKALSRVIEQSKPDIFGISVFSPSLAPSLFAFQWVKQEYPSIETLMGGGIFADQLALDSSNLDLFLKKTESTIDAVFVGEGERLLTKYLSGELKKGSRLYSLNDIGGETIDLSCVPPPDFSGLNLSAYSQMAIYASRSCPFQCGFCSETVQWGKYRKKTGKQIVDEIDSIKNIYGGKLFMFGDSLVNPVIKELSDCLIEKGTDIYWDGYLRTDPEVCDLSLTNHWRKGGFYRARLGVESGSQNVLNLMNKKMPVQQIKNAVSALAKAGIKTTTYWVVGYPGETEEDFKQTLALLTELKNDIYEADWHPFYFFPKGQVRSNQWVNDYGIESMYPEKFNDLLILQTWKLKTNPTPADIGDRMNRFGETCRKMNIPNPYSMMDIFKADKRWKELHPNCGPSLLELHNNNHLK